MHVMRVLVTACFALAGLAGCGTGTKYLDPRNDLDRQLYYTERDSSGASHQISGIRDERGAPIVQRVPMPGGVDIDSTIQIDVSAKLAVPKPGSAVVTDPDNLLERKKAIEKIVASLADVVRARARALKAFEEKNVAEFRDALKESNSKETLLRQNLEKLWPATSPSRSIVVQEYGKDRRTFRPLQELLVKEVAAIEASHRQLEADLRKRSRTLSLEAFLTSPGKQPAAIHLDGYDTIKAESLVRRDPLGLDLQPDERSKLNEQMNASRELADTLNRLRNGEVEVNQAVRRIAAQLSPRLGAIAEEANDLYKEALESSVRIKQTQEIFDAFLAVAEASEPRVGAAAKASLRKARDDLVKGLPKDLQAAQSSVQQLVNRVNDLRAKWQQGKPDALTPDVLANLIIDATKAVNDIRAAAAQVPQVVAGVKKQTSDAATRLEAELKQEAAKLLDSAEFAALRADLRRYVADVERIEGLIGEVTSFVTALQQNAAELPAATSSTLDIPLDQIKNTFINLEQTPRLAGDLITVRATLKDGGQASETSIASFRVNRYGHYFELSPAVVLAKPQQIAGNDTGFRFAPTLSWLYRYGPRPDDTSSPATWLRLFDPSIGIHSAFLNFNSPTSNSAAQIGLGATFALWKNRLQFGYGVNLMARSADEGRIYYFIGSDLIGLLQAVGVMKPQ